MLHLNLELRYWHANLAFSDTQVLIGNIFSVKVSLGYRLELTNAIEVGDVFEIEMFTFQNKTLWVNISYVDSQLYLKHTFVHLATFLLSAQV